ncbi:hypothetical protein BpHYR1_026077, partial [Brachionus plicatilis]
ISLKRSNSLKSLNENHFYFTYCLIFSYKLIYFGVYLKKKFPTQIGLFLTLHPLNVRKHALSLCHSAKYAEFQQLLKKLRIEFSTRILLKKFNGYALLATLWAKNSKLLFDPFYPSG